MITVKPFRALRPREDMVEVISSENFDSSFKHLSIEEMQRNPLSYLHVAKQHLNFPDEKKSVDKHFPLAKTQLNELISQGLLVKEAKPAYYLYRQVKDGHSYLGIIAGVHAEDFKNNRIRKHEHTRTDKEYEMAKHMEITETIGTAVLVTYHNTETIDTIMANELNKKPTYDFIQRGVRHSVWVISDEKTVETISKELSNLSDVYIADGHHRSASLVNHYLQRRSENKNHTGQEAYNFLQTYFVPANLLFIYEYNRVVKVPSSKSGYKVIKKICENFKVEKYKKGPCKPDKMHQFGMYFEGAWYLLKAKDKIVDELHPLKVLDVSILEDYILKPILEIKDSKTDERIAFIDGSKGLDFLQERVDKGKFDIAFTLYPTTIEQVMAVADINETMPPKSTWIEPKMRTGFIVQDLRS